MFHVEHSLEILEFNSLLGIIADFTKGDASREIEPFLHKVRPKGAVLDQVGLSGMMAFLSTANSIFESDQI